MAEGIKALRVGRGRTQSEVAERMGVPQSQVSRWENKGGCELESLERLCRALSEKRAVKVTALIWKYLTDQADSGWEQSVRAEFELYSRPQEQTEGGASGLAAEIGRYISGRFPFPTGKAHTKSGVRFRISVEGENQAEEGALERQY